MKDMKNNWNLSTRWIILTLPNFPKTHTSYTYTRITIINESIDTIHENM